MIENTTLLFENIAKLVSLNLQDELVGRKWFFLLLTFFSSTQIILIFVNIKIL